MDLICVGFMSFRNPHICTSQIYPIIYQLVRQLVLDEWKSLSVPLMHPLKLRASLNLDLKKKRPQRYIYDLTIIHTKMFLSEP